MKVPFSQPDISDVEINEVVAAMRSGWITRGPRTRLLEQRLADYVGASKCLCLGSQTACSEMALRALQIGPGDEVITSAYTYTASASVIDHVGAKIVLVDTQPDSIEMDYDRVAEAVTERTKAIIAVDVGGFPCDYARLFQIAESKKELFQPKGELQCALGRIAVIADTAHSLGAQRDGKMCGTLADFSAFSFHAVKNFTTAEGGALTWCGFPGVDNDWLYNHIQLMSLHGQSVDALERSKKGTWEYDIVGPWYKCNMTDIAAAMGLGQLQRYEGMLKRRMQIIARYDAAFLPLGVKVLPHNGPNYRTSGHLYLTRIPGITPDQRNEIIRKMVEQEIACNVHYKPLPMHTAYKKMGFQIADFPNAYNYFANEITLPLHTCLTDEQVDHVIEQYTQILKEYIV